MRWSPWLMHGSGGWRTTGRPARARHGLARLRETVVNGRPAFYGEAGSGPGILFLHGWGLDHKAYKRALSRLVRAGLHVYAPALPGFGRTAGLKDRPIGLSSYGDWVATFLDAVGVTSPVLVMGHSFGGGVAVTLAHDHPDHVRALV